MASLRLVPVSGAPIEVTRDQSLVGRDPSCEIVVSDGSVSRRHARLEKRGGAWFVVDQGSANGTYVNSLRVAEHALKNGQELRFGALAFRVDILEDPEATVATPIVKEERTVMAAPSPPPLPPSPPPIPPAPRSTASPTPPRVSAQPTPPRAAAAPPPPAPSAAAARDRFRPAGSPVPPMAGGAPPAKKGRGPFFWIGIGCCGCLLLVAVLAGVLGGGAYLMTKGAADAAHAWLAEVRQGQLDTAYNEGLSSAYRSQLTREDFEALAARVGRSTDATFWQRSTDNDRAVLKGFLTTGSGRQPITLKLVKEDGAWRIDQVDFGAD